MAIIVDPDNIDRNQVIYGTLNSRKISIYPVGNVRSFLSGTLGVASASLQVFAQTGATFITSGVAAGDVLSLYTGQDAGHYVILSASSQTQLVLQSASWLGNATRTNFSGSSGITWEVRFPLTGSLVDGVTKQALYSFTKEEWRSDSATYGGDDLIRHEFPYEAITSEQFELGGGLSHENWDYHNNYTRKKIRTGGWAKKNESSNTLENYTGIITLGSLDSDSQIYYQPLSESSDPIDFTFTGPVNESILVSSSYNGFDTRSYLKLFARKKGRTYSQASLTDIGVTSIQTIVNRFPLAHVPDAAIVSSDAEISGSSPFRNNRQLVSNTNGVTANVDGDTGTFTSSGATFLSSVRVGDLLYITAGTDTGFFTVTAVDSNTQLTVNTSEQAFVGGTGHTFTVRTTIIIPSGSDGVISNVNGATGQFVSAVGGFQNVVDTDDILILRGPTTSGSFIGAYKIVTSSNNTTLTVDTTDQRWPTPASGGLSFYIVEPGMYLQYKEDNLGPFNAGTLVFTASTPPQIRRNTGVWTSNGLDSGSILTIVGSTNNDGTYTVGSINAATASLITTDVLVNEGPVSASVTGFNAFKRVIQGTTYGFHWRLFGNDATLADHYEFVQHQLRRTYDIDFSNNLHRGDVTDLLMQFASPTATTFDMYIDDLDVADFNNVTYTDVTDATRINAFVAAGTISFNDNLTSDAAAIYRMFFTTNPTGDYGTTNAIIVQNDAGVPITGSVSAQSSVSFTFDYDNNVQGGRTPATDAAVTVVAIGLSTAQFVLAQATIARSKSNNISLVAALERNYSNT